MDQYIIYCVVCLHSDKNEKLYADTNTANSMYMYQQKQCNDKLNGIKNPKQTDAHCARNRKPKMSKRKNYEEEEEVEEQSRW